MDRISEHANDVKFAKGVSDCCGAPVYLDLCSECHEHCGIIEEEESDLLDERSNLE